MKKQLIFELSEQRTHLISQMVATFEVEELHKLSGRVFEVNNMIEKLENEKDD